MTALKEDECPTCGQKKGTNRASCAECAATCGFCHGRPVLNARAWYRLGESPHVPCPRCGETAT